jgi:hypothetical protein
MARLPRATLLVLLVTGLSALGAPAASAAPTGTGLLRMVHLSPDTPSVDAYIDSVSAPGTGVVLPAVTYGDVSPYQTVPAGTYTVSARQAGSDPATPPALATTVTVEAGTATTIAGVGRFVDLGLAVLPDDLTLPPAGSARTRVINAAAAAPALDVTLADTSLARDLAFPEHTEYVDVPGGAGTLTVAGGATPTELPVDLAAGSVYSVLVLDRSDGGLTVQTVLDAASPGVVPVGGVEAGAGGTAGGDQRALLPLGMAVLAVLALLGTVGPRLTRRTATPRHSAS